VQHHALQRSMNGIVFSSLLSLSSRQARISHALWSILTRPQTIDDIVSQTVYHVLDQFDIETDRLPRWKGLRAGLQHKSNDQAEA
jgi:3-polyprenyl-4-hydroxybenzoate decarboxylase